jgi:hypothetical protein
MVLQIIKKDGNVSFVAFILIKFYTVPCAIYILFMTAHRSVHELKTKGNNKAISPELLQNMYLSICGLFNDATNISDYVEGYGRDLIC